MVLPGLFLSCPSEHGAKQRLEGSLHLCVAAYHPSFLREEGWGRGWPPYPLLGAGDQRRRV